MSDVSSFAELAIKAKEFLYKRVMPSYICEKGFNVVKEVWGQPIDVKENAGLYYKLPLYHSIHIVDMRLRVINMYAHSFKVDDLATSTKVLPYNRSIDAQIIYKVTDPLIDYEIDREEQDDYIISRVHDLLHRIEIEKVDNLQQEITTALKQEEIDGLEIEDIVVTSNDYLISHRSTE